MEKIIQITKHPRFSKPKLRFPNEEKADVCSLPSKCPVKGGTFGVTFQRFLDCPTCAKWNQCEDESDRLARLARQEQQRRRLKQEGCPIGATAGKHFNKRLDCKRCELRTACFDEQTKYLLSLPTKRSPQYLKNREAKRQKLLKQQMRDLEREFQMQMAEAEKAWRKRQRERKLAEKEATEKQHEKIRAQGCPFGGTLGVDYENIQDCYRRPRSCNSLVREVCRDEAVRFLTEGGIRDGFTDVKCKKCEGWMVVRKNRWTTERFLGCENWPACTNTEKLHHAIKEKSAENNT